GVDAGELLAGEREEADGAVVAGGDHRVGTDESDAVRGLVSVAADRGHLRLRARARGETSPETQRAVLAAGDQALAVLAERGGGRGACVSLEPGARRPAVGGPEADEPIGGGRRHGRAVGREGEAADPRLALEASEALAAL